MSTQRYAAEVVEARRERAGEARVRRGQTPGVSPLVDDAGMTSWDDLLDDFAFTIGCLGEREFLVVEYRVGLDPDPYAQVAPEPDGSWYCEVVSGLHLPASRWPMDEFALVASGWDPPIGRQTNWSLSTESPKEATRLLIEGLRSGRGCGDPARLVGTLGRWPSDPDDGDPVPDPPRGPFGLAA